MSFFLVQFKVSSPVLQSPCRGRKKASYLSFKNGLPDAILLSVFCAFLSQKHMLICVFGLLLWLILVSHAEYADLQGSEGYCFTHEIQLYVPAMNTIGNSNTFVKVLFEKINPSQLHCHIHM